MAFGVRFLHSWADRCTVATIDPFKSIFSLGKNRNRSNRFFAIYCDLLRFIAIYCDFFLGNQIRHQEKTEEDCKDLLPSMDSFLGTVESSE